MSKATCLAPDCEATSRCRGNCSRHYNSLRQLILRSKENDEPVTWELLIDAGLATPATVDHPLSGFITGVLATLAERRRSKESTS
ncbi:hypothetical protein LCGC14_0336620 [marine sediment metagenome]|uniref:Uncharacterized protein n=1 Tax=marine sediment metagenome TaxID=412755 RepID=A0A0F9TXZ1_9ZZZZ